MDKIVKDAKPVYLTREQSNAIDLIRVIATVMIVACHIFQGLDNELAYWFNIGVQVFLCMSGFLLAHSIYTSKVTYLRRRLIRIIIPYWIVLGVAFLLYSSIDVKINMKEIIIYLLGIQGIVKISVPGLGHLWYITIIIICYFIIIYLDSIKEKVRGLKERQFYILLAITCGVVQIIFLPISGSYAPWVMTFIIGYFISFRYSYQIPKVLFSVTLIGTLLTTTIRIYFSYIYELPEGYIDKIFNSLYIPWSKMLLGGFLFIAGYEVFQKLYQNKEQIKLVKFISGISYEIYLVHLIFILGPFSLLGITKHIILNIAIIIALSIITALGLNKLVKRLLKKR